MPTLKPLHVFDFNGTLVGKELSAATEAHTRKEIYEPLFSTLSGISKEDWEKRFPEAATLGLSPEVVRERVLPIISNPPKFTPARAAYYHVMEGEIRNGKIDTGLAPDTVAEGSVFEYLEKAHIEAMVISRGTLSLIEAILDATPALKKYVSFFDSTIPYGNMKSKDTYLKLVEHLKEKGYEAKAFYDDEAIFVKEIYLAGKELEVTAGSYPFRVFWINRSNADEKELWDLFPEEERADAKKRIGIHPNLSFNPL